MIIVVLISDHWSKISIGTYLGNSMKHLFVFIVASLFCYSSQAQSSINYELNLVTAVGIDARYSQSMSGACGAFSPDGNLISVLSSGVYETNTGNLRFATIGNLSPFSPDGTRIVAGLNIHDTSTGQIVWRLPSMETGYIGFIFSDDGAYLAVSDRGIFELGTGTQVQALPLMNPNSFTPTNRLLLDSGAYDAPIQVYDVLNGEVVQSFGNNEILGNSSFSQTGDILFVGGQGFYTAADWQLLFRANGSSARFSEDDRYVFVSRDGLYSVPDFRRLIPSQGIYGVFSSDGQYVAAVDEGVIAIAGGERVINSTGYLPNFDPRNRFVAMGGDGVYDLETGDQVLELASDAVFSSDGSLLGVSGDGIYSVNNWERLATIDGRAIFNSTNTAFAVSAADHCSIYSIETS